MYSRKLYLKITGSVLLLLLLSLCGAWLLITEMSFTLAFGCLVFILLITLFLIRLTNDTNRRISIFFEALRQNDTTCYYPDASDDPFLHSLYGEMNRITSLFRESQKEVEEKELYYAGILQVLTHEIRNSITPITSLSADLLTHAGGDVAVEITDGLSVINSQARNLNTFLDSYHRLTHLPDPQRQSVDIASLFGKLNRLLCAEPGSDRITYHSPEAMRIAADPNLLTLALINLVRNALQVVAGLPEGQVLVEASTIDNHPRITITDNGPGIPPELLSAIFTPFFSTKKGGSGIGLSLSKRIMQLHGGQITVFSLPDVRTAFVLEFL